MTFLLVSFMAWVLREDIFTHISAIRVFQMAARCPPQLSDIVRSPRTYRTILRSMGEEIDPFFHSNELPPSFTTRKVKRKNSSLSLQKMGSFLFSRRCSYRLPASPSRALGGKVAIGARRKFAPWISLDEALTSPSSPQEGHDESNATQARKTIPYLSGGENEVAKAGAKHVFHPQRERNFTL